MSEHKVGDKIITVWGAIGTIRFLPGHSQEYPSCYGIKIKKSGATQYFTEAEFSLMKRLKQQLSFIKEIGKLKSIIRRSYLCDDSRFENTAEHSWHLALMVIALSEHSNQEIDVPKTIQMILIHDLVEIDAGDTFCYDSAGNATKADREEKAADRIFGLLPSDQEQICRQLWEEFEAKETPESLFANAVDRLMPLIQSVETQGHAWKEFQVSKDQVMERCLAIKDGSAALWNYAETLIEDAAALHLLS